MSLSRTVRIRFTTRGMTAYAAACAAVALTACSPLDALDDASTGSAPAPGSATSGGSAGAAVDEATARDQLAQLTVEPEGTLDGYDRDEFPHWSGQGGNCNTREVVLKRDGTDVRTGDDCYPTSGTWDSPYDGGTWTDPSDVDIDHVVPLAEAWRTGAAEWTTERRERFANDLDGVNLLAVTDNVNQAKGDDGPEQWRPPLESYWCTYAVLWIDVKHTWDLTVEEAEKSTLADMLDRC